MHTTSTAFDTVEQSSVTSIDGHDAASITIPDAHFLFHAEFTRAGSDLTLTGEDGHRVVVPGYFKHEHLPTLLSPEGAALTGDVVEALVGSQAPGQYAQAGAPVAPAAQVIGKVDKASGSVSVVRNGVTVNLNVGDTVNKGDVVQTGSNSVLVVSFVDGTALSLSASTRMALNEINYDASSATGNSGVLSLIQGGFAFIAGHVAHTGGLNINTPVGIMGIRGTAGGSSCADSGNCQFFASLNVDGSVSVYEVAPNAADPNAPPVRVEVGTLAQISASGQIVFTPASDLNPGINNLMTQLLRDYPQIIQNLLQPTPPADPQSIRGGYLGSSYTVAVDLPKDKLTVPPGTGPDGGTTTPVIVTFIQPPPNPPPQPPLTQPTTVEHPIANQSVAEDTSWHFTIATPFSDPDAVLSATLANGDPLSSVGLSFDPLTLTFSGTTPQDFNGAIVITVKTGDGSVTDSFTLNVTPVNDAPKAVDAFVAPPVTHVDHFSDSHFDGWAAVSLGNSSMSWSMNGHSAAEKSNAGVGFLKAPADLAPPAAAAYTISVFVDPNTSFGESTRNNGVGVVFGFVDSDNYYKAYWADYGTNYSGSDPDYRDLILSRVVNGMETVLSRVDDIDLGGSNIHFQVVVGPDGITVNVQGNGHDVQLTSADTPILNGVGLYTADNDDGVAYDDFTVSVSDARQATEQTSLNLKGTGLSIGDVDAGPGDLTVTLSVAEGTLHATAGNSGAVVAGDGTSSLTITGTLLEINSLLGSSGTSTLSYIDDTNTPGVSTTLTLVVNDGGNTGDGGDLVGSHTSTILINAVNDAPVIHTPAGGIHYWAFNTIGDVTTINHISFDDVDAGTVQVTLSMNEFGDSLNAHNFFGSGVTVFGDGTSQVRLQGTIADINNYLFHGDLTWNPAGSDNHELGLLTVTIDDNSTSSGGNVVSTQVWISEINNPVFNSSPNAVDFSGVNFTQIGTVNAGGGNDTITTSWSHQGGVTTYNGGAGIDTIHLVFTPDQLSEILANTTYRNELQSFLDNPLESVREH